MAFDLRITEIFAGQEGKDLTSDWFEITNRGTTAWTQGTDADLFYDDDSEDPLDADMITGLTTIAPGESVIVLVDGTDVDAFRAAWGDVIDLDAVQIGFIADTSGLSGGGDAVTLFADLDGDGLDAGDILDSAAYPDTEADDGQTWDVGAQAFSVAGEAGAVTTTATGGDAGDVPNVGSPGVAPEMPEMPDAEADFTLELLHFTDQEAAAAAVRDAPNLSAVLNALRAQDLGDDGMADNTLTLSSGDAFIPGLFYDASGPVFGSAGIADIQIQNELGVQAIALGNHEFDFGTAALAGLIDGGAPGDFTAFAGTALAGQDFAGTAFPYLSANLDFSTDANMAPLAVDGGQAPQGNVVTSSTVIDVNAEMIGVVGATTPTLASISSPGGVGIAPQPFAANPTSEQLDALAAEIQAEVDTLLTANPDMDKVILLAHMQKIDIELELAGRLSGVDVIVGGGSNTRLFDENDRPRDLDSDQGQYPMFMTDADGNSTAVVNTDGSYKYVGRLVLDFDDEGRIIPSSYDADVSGAYATDDAGVVEVAAPVLVFAPMSEDQETADVPDTAATGSFGLDFIDTATGMVTISGSFFGLTDANPDNALMPVGSPDPEGNPQSAIHLHAAPAGANGGIVRNFAVTDNGDGSGSFTGSFTLSPEEMRGLLLGETYINLHTTDHAGGQLRGQVDIADALEFSGLIDPEIQAIADAIEAQILATESNVFGVSDVFLNGNRSGTGEADDPDGVRTQETNLGNLTADANLAAAKDIDADVVISIKNGGGIRTSIGETIVPPGGDAPIRTANQAVVDGDGNIVKPVGGISQNDIQTALAFNNGLTLLTLTRAEILAVLEHGVSALPGVAGQFPQISGLAFSYDADNAVGERIVDAAIVDPETGDIIAELAEDGALVGDASETFRIVTLNFLAEPRFDDAGNFIGGGDGYPFPNTNTDPAVGEVGPDAARVNPVALTQDGVRTGDATFADDGTEQDALAEYLFDTYNPANGGEAYDMADTGPEADNRIIDVDAPDTSLLAPEATEQLTFTRTQLNADSDSGSEIPAFDPASGKIFVAGGETTLEVITLAADLTASEISAIDIAALVPGASAVTSVSTKNGIVAAAVQVEDENGQANGRVVFLNAADNSLIASVEVGVGPDMVTFTPDGTKVLTADEGEFSDDQDPAGSISIIDITAADPATWVADVNGFEDFDAADLRDAGVRLFPGIDPALDLEPEYIAVSPDSTTAFVTLQEANAIAAVDLASGEITGITALGTVDHSLPGNAMDTNDEDDIFDPQTVPVQGLRMPDGLASFEIDGQTYVITANEGDARNADARLADLTLDPDAFPDAADLQDDANAGRLEISTIDGDTDGDGDFDELYSYGGRSFSIFDDEGTLVFDSGNLLALIAEDAGIRPDGRSDNKGVEPENVTVGQIGTQTFAFVTLERASAIAVFDVTDPTEPAYVNLISDAADSEPEGLVFVSAMDSPSGKPLLIVTNEGSTTTVVHEIEVPGGIRTTIAEVQGAGHVSPFVKGAMTDAEFLAALPDGGSSVNSGVIVRVEGRVTAVDSNGFYLQDPVGDGAAATSEAIFVFTGAAPTVAAGDSVAVTGEVSEFFPGGIASGNLPTTQIGGATVETIDDLADVAPTLIGEGGIVLPDMTINDDSFASFDVSTDGQDAFEALEGMLVTAQDMIVTAGTNGFGEIFGLVDQGKDASGLSMRGTINISPDDFNPERIQIDEDSGVFDFDFPEVDTGDLLGDVTGVLGYAFGNFEIIPTVDFTGQIVDGGLAPEVTSLTVGANEISIATYNVLNLDTVIEDPANLLPGTSGGVDDDLGDGRFAAIADQIVTNLAAPDIIGLQEIQDNTGAEGTDDVTSASDTLETLIDAIVAAGGPEYAYIDNTFITDDLSGGIPGGNIRTAFLYNPARVSLIPDSVKTIGSQTDGAFAGGRLPLVASFGFGTETVTVVNNHFSSKGGSAPILGTSQDFAERQEDTTVNGSLDERQAQSAAVQDFVSGLMDANAEANVVVLGDFNEFEFVSPLTGLEDAGLVNLTTTLPEDERYSYNFQGSSQSLDHILVSDNLADGAAFDAVHVNSEFAETDARASDHDPLLATIDFGTEDFEGVEEGFELALSGLFELNDLTVTGSTVTFGNKTFTVDADLGTANFLSAITGGSTKLALVDELLGDGIDLFNKTAVAEEEINGIAFDDYLTGTGQADFTVTLGASGAGYDNALGYYVYDSAAMTASDVTILSENVKEGGTFTIENVAEGSELVFFVVRDGADTVDDLSDELVFDFTGARPQLLDDGAEVDVDIYHSLGAAFNPDGVEHFLSGTVDDGGAMRIGVEDLLNAGDSDYQDVVFTVTRDEDLLLTA